MENIAETIIALLRGVEREGMDRVIRYLQGSDFFAQRCHTHHKFVGGLAEHSLETYRIIEDFRKMGIHKGLSADSVIIVALLHDICTCHNGGTHDFMRGGHGRRSVGILEQTCGLRLTDEERTAIERHMHRPRANEPLAAAIYYADKMSGIGNVVKTFFMGR